jgi:hypothetical protein
MGPLVMAWLVGEGIIIYRTVKQIKGPPSPGQLMLSSGIFVLCALIAESEQARPIGVSLAWGFDIAAFMNLFGTGKPKTSGITWKPAMALASEVIPSGGLSALANIQVNPSSGTQSGTGTGTVNA